MSIVEAFDCCGWMLAEMPGHLLMSLNPLVCLCTSATSYPDVRLPVRVQTPAHLSLTQIETSTAFLYIMSTGSCEASTAQQLCCSLPLSLHVVSVNDPCGQL